MILIDSCGWLEFLADGPKAEQYSPYFQQIESIFTSTITLYEVARKVRNEYGEEKAIQVSAQILQTRVLPVTPAIAMLAAQKSLEYQLPLADAIIYATGLMVKCEIVTGDKHFKGLPGVAFVE